MKDAIYGLLIIVLASMFLWDTVLLWKHGMICRYGDNHAFLGTMTGLLAALIAFTLVMVVLDVRKALKRR